MTTRLLLALLAALPLVSTDLAPTGTLRASFLATNPVQGRVDATTGAITGPVADLVRELARREGIPYSLLPVPNPAAVIDSLASGRADIGFLAVEAARATQVDFSEPYALMGSAYLVPADSGIVRSSDVDRAGVIVAAVKGQSQQIFVNANLRQARIVILDAMPPDDAVASMLTAGTANVFAANRERMIAVAAASPAVRVLDDDFFVVGQAIVAPKGDRARIDVLNRFVADVTRSGFVRSSLDRAALGSVKVATAGAR